jgi:hypothetical protein
LEVMRQKKLSASWADIDRMTKEFEASGKGKSVTQADIAKWVEDSYEPQIKYSEMDVDIDELIKQARMTTLARELKETGSITLATPSPSNLGVNPELAVIIRGMARVSVNVAPEVSQSLEYQHGITELQQIGVQPLTQQQIITIAKSAGVTKSAINEAVKTNTLAQVTINALANNKIMPQAQIEALISTLAKSVVASEVMPMSIEVQQAQVVISPEIIAQATPEQLVQIEQAQQTITQVNEQIAQQVSQQASIEQQAQVQQAQQTLQQVVQQIAVQTGITQLYDNKPPDKNKLKPRIPPSSGDDEDVEEYKKKLEFSGAVTWRQGAFYKAWKYPYSDTDADLATFKEPPPSAVMVDGGGTPQETLSLMGKTAPPPDRIVDMGVVEFHITTDDNGNLRIKYSENKEATRGDAWFSDGVPMKHRKTKHKSSKSSNYIASSGENWLMSGSV